MAVATLKQIRAALVTALQAKLGTTGQQVSGYVLRNPTLPTVWVRPKPDTPIVYHQAMGPNGGGVQQWLFLVEAYCGDPYDIAAQEKLDEYVSPGASSIVEALEADTTLGGVVQALKVVQANAYVEFVRADGNPAIGANWQVEIYP